MAAKTCIIDLIYLKENLKGKSRAGLVPEVSCHAAGAAVYNAQSQQRHRLPAELQGST